MLKLLKVLLFDLLLDRLGKNTNRFVYIAVVLVWRVFRMEAGLGLLWIWVEDGYYAHA
jgi:hypothetical protein